MIVQTAYSLQRTPWVCAIDGKSDEDWIADLNALEAVMRQGLTLHLLEGLAILKSNKNQDHL